VPGGAEEAAEERQAPGDEEQRAGESGLRADLRVVGFTGLQLDVEPLGSRPGIAQAEALRVMDDRSHPVAEAVEVAPDRGLAEADRPRQPAAVRKRTLGLGLRLLVRQVARKPVRAGGDRMEDRS